MFHFVLGPITRNCRRNDLGSVTQRKMDVIGKATIGMGG